MPREEDIQLRFVSEAQAEDTFIVAEFKGSEGISRLYEFEILLYSEDPEIDLKAVLQSPATLTIIQEGDVERKIHGIPAMFEQLHEYDDYIYYRVRLVPRLWLADQYHENALFLDKKVPEIIEEILKQAGLTSQDYELKLTGSYNPWEYVCQYNETDFDFISRWMEREGIYYFFDQSGDAEKLIITDNSTAHQCIQGGAVAYSPPGQATPGVVEQVREFTCRQQILPKKVILKDYNYRKPSLDLKGESDVDSDGRGEVYLYGEHFKTPEEGNALAKIRSEELLCREAVFYGESTVSPFVTGYLFELEEHYRDSYNQKYLITEVTHQAVQADFLAMAADTSRITELDGQSYENRITCIPESKQFRPERTTKKPRIDGTLNAKIDAAGDGQYAEIDDEGRYKVILPFDLSGNSDGKASRWVRMAQPYAGADYGMHFPLHKGIEVLLTFIDGDPDRPVIVGSVPNPETGSPVKGGNQSQCVISTGGGNRLEIEDSQGGERIKMSTPHSDTWFSMGAPNSPGEGFDFSTVANWFARVGSDAVYLVDGNEEIEIKGDTSKITYGNERKTTIGQCAENFVGTKTTKKLANEIELVVGGKESLFIGFVVDVKAGGSLARSPQEFEFKGVKIKKKANVQEQIGKIQQQIGSFSERVGALETDVTDAFTKFGKLDQQIGKLTQEVGSATIHTKGAYSLKADGDYSLESPHMEMKGNLVVDSENIMLLGDDIGIGPGTVKICKGSLKIV